MKSLLFTVLLCITYNATANVIDSNDILKDLKSTSVNDEMQKINAQGEWQTVLNNIKTGKSKWLNVAKEIQTGTDAGTAEDLTEAVAFAIPNNAQGVLSILNDDSILNVNSVCVLPVYNVTDEQYNKLVVDSIRVLYKLPNSKACIDRMVNNIGTSLPPQKDL